MKKLTESQLHEASLLTAKRRKHAIAHFGHEISDEDWLAIRNMRADHERAIQEKLAEVQNPLSEDEMWMIQAENADRERKRIAEKKALDAAGREKVAALPTFELWPGHYRESALMIAPVCDLDENHHLGLAILDLIAQNALKMGWTVKRSKARNGRKSSVYVTPNGGDQVRISDHRLPPTGTRQLRESMGVSGSWAGEIITSEIMHETLEGMMREIRIIAGLEE